MKANCRVCSQLAAEGSIFCAHHRRQAELFSTAFGQQSETLPEGTPPQEIPAAAEPDASAPAVLSPQSNASFPGPQASDELPALGPKPEHGSPSARTTASSRESAEGLGTAQPDQNDEERAVLAEVVHCAFDRLRSRRGEAAEPGGWPQLCIYFLGETLHCRAYFAILSVCNAETEPASEYTLDESCVHEAVTVGGLVFEELWQYFRDHIEALRTQQISALHLHFLNSAGLIAINVQGRDHDQRNLGAFVFDGEGFRKAALEQVAARIGHGRW